MKSIETKFYGCRFRSRLEARWAAFFTLLNWEWDYEPIDFNGWIPDFVLYGKYPIYVEVKPVIDFPQEVADKLASSGCKSEMLIVGQKLHFEERATWCAIYIGWLFEQGENSWNEGWDFAPLGRWEAGEGAIGFCHSDGGFRDRISGGYDGGHWGDGEVSVSEIKEIWNRAGSMVRWESYRA